MKNNIFIPKVINVGYQERPDTYTGRLAYVIYYDEKGKLRKEVSWENWRDKNIQNEEFDNVPTSGFVLNKKAGDYSNGWDHRQAYCRVYDPRNFEFEITIENLLYILSNTNSIKGKGLEGEFVYGWDGKNLVLMPVDAPDYKELVKYNSILHENNYVKTKDLKIGATYLGKDNIQYVYMGKFDKYDYGYWKNGIFFYTYKKMVEYCEENNVAKKRVGCRRLYMEDKYAPGMIGKEHCFYYKGKDYKCNETDEFLWKSTISKFFIEVIDDGCHANYADYFEKLEGTTQYSPFDEDKKTWHEMDMDTFVENATWVFNNSIRYTTIRFYANVDGKILKFEARGNSYGKNEYVLWGYTYTDEGRYHGDYEILDIFPIEEIGQVKHMIPVAIEEIFEKMHPLYEQSYLKNGREYRRRYAV